VEGGVTRQTYGGNKVAETLNTSLTERKYRLFTDIESYIVRLAMERVSEGRGSGEGRRGGRGVCVEETLRGRGVCVGKTW
jgi:hypothetical protein